MQYIATYTQEVSHLIDAPDTHAAGSKAKEYARNNKALVVLSVYRKDLEPIAGSPRV
jgi:hypothetical protein